MSNKLYAYLNDTLVGVITANTRNRQRVQFTVTPSYDGPASALSEGFSLLAGTTPGSEHVSNFLGGYLPEGNQRDALAAKVPALDGTDLFGMLRSYGVTMAGSLSVRTDDPNDDITPTYEPLNRSGLRKKLLEARDAYTLGNDPDSGRSTIAGFQPKLLLARFDGEWFHPLRRAHSTHIVKPAPVHRPSIIADEFYSHQITRRMGLTRFNSELIGTGSTSYLAIERYDRRVLAPFEVQMFHQEDAAQALGLDWVGSAAKFQDRTLPNRADRPSAVTIAELFGSMGTNNDDVERWFRYLVYNVLVGNHDGHAKNVSIIHEGNSACIADLYDAVPIMHPNDDPLRVDSDKIKDDLALSIGGEFSHGNVTREHFLAEAKTWGVFTEDRADRLLGETFEDFATALDAVEPPAGISNRLRDRLGYNFERLSAGKPIGKPKLPLRPWSRRVAEPGL